MVRRNIKAINRTGKQGQVELGTEDLECESYDSGNQRRRSQGGRPGNRQQWSL